MEVDDLDTGGVSNSAHEVGRESNSATTVGGVSNSNTDGEVTNDTIEETVGGVSNSDETIG